MASHRAQLLLNLLPNALTYGLQEVEPEHEPLKVRSGLSFPISMLVEFPLLTRIWTRIPQSFWMIAMHVSSSLTVIQCHYRLQVENEPS